MRISEDRYVRDLRRIHLAQHLIQRQVRTASIRLWTGLSEERVRNLARSYPAQHAEQPRHRGPARSSLTEFMRQTPLRSEASAMTAMACLYGVVPLRRPANARRDVPGVATGERLSRAYALYRQVVSEGRLTLEHSMLLAVAVSDGTDAKLALCAECHGSLLLDPSDLRREICFWCKSQELRAAHTSGTESFRSEEVKSSAAPTETGTQQDLFPAERE